MNFPSPEALLDPLFTGDSPNNFTRYRSAEFDDLMAEGPGHRWTTATVQATATPRRPG